MAKCGNRADNKLQEEKVAALEDEVDFLSAKLKEEEQARKAAQREAGPQFLFQGWVKYVFLRQNILNIMMQAHTLRKELDQHRAHEQEHRASGACECAFECAFDVCVCVCVFVCAFGHKNSFIHKHVY